MKIRQTALVLPAALGLLAAGAAPALAAAGTPAVASKTIYMTTFTSNSTLNRISPATGAKTFIGYTGASLTDLSFRASTLEAVSFSRLYTVNPTTGRAVSVGALGFNDINALVTSSKGQLYAAGNVAPGRFVSVNAATGKAHQIGTFGAGLSSAGDLAYLGSVLYATVDRAGFQGTYLAKVNPSTGHATLVGNTGLRNAWGLTVRSGILYAATSNGFFLRLSPTTGKATVIGSNGANQAGLATSP